MTSNLRQEFGVIIIAIKKISGDMIYNPGPDEQFHAGDVIVVIGKTKELEKMAESIG